MFVAPNLQINFDAVYYSRRVWTLSVTEILDDAEAITILIKMGASMCI